LRSAREKEKRENNGEVKPTWSTLYAYMEMLQQIPPIQLLYTNKNV
jgi:hypothetical protein